MPQKKISATGKAQWVARWRDPAGRDRSKSFTTRRDAKAHEDHMNAQRRAGTYFDPDVQRTTVTQLFTEWIRSRDLRPASIAAYEHTRDRYLDWLGDYPAVQVTKADAIQWYRDLQGGHRNLGPTTARNALRHLRSAMVWGVDNGILERNPVKIPPSDMEIEPDEIPTLAEIRRVVECVREGGAPYVDKKRRDTTTERMESRTYYQQPNEVIADCMETAAMTGLRISEVIALNDRAGDIQLGAGVIRVRKQLSKGANRRRVDLKTRASRRDVPIPAELRPILERRMAAAGPDGYLFTSTTGKTLLTSRVAVQVKRAATHVGAPSVHFHALRHFYVSSLLTAGVPVQDVAEVVGHGNPAITLRIYAHVIAGSRDRIADAVSSAVGRGISAGSPHLRVVGE